MSVLHILIWNTIQAVVYVMYLYIEGKVEVILVKIFKALNYMRSLSDEESREENSLQTEPWVVQC